jgi:signal transduction histidine kinase
MSSAEPLNVLIVEDSQDDTELILHELRQAGFNPTSKRVETEPDFLAEINKQPDIILSDYSMPHFTGLRAVKLLRETGLNIPFLLISGTVGEEIAVEAMKYGASDYLLKDRLARLGNAVRLALEKKTLCRQRQQAEEALRHSEAQFIEAQKMEMIAQLAGGVAHDFNNILAVIMAYSDLIDADAGNENAVRGYNGEIRHASERAAGVTRQLLVFSRKQAVKPVVLDINRELSVMNQMLQRLVGGNNTLEIVPGKDLGHIKADSGYLGQLLMNLVVNARDAMPDGGAVTIATNNVRPDESFAREQPGAITGDFVMLSVNDTGTGMTDEVKSRIFEAFFTTKPEGKGTGLGLATCQTIVQQSGGHIICDSEAGKGTTFKIYFPRVEAPVDVAARQVQNHGNPATLARQAREMLDNP